MTNQLTMLEAPAARPKHQDTWGEVIYYLDGWAWGITKRGETKCLGLEASVREAITDPKLLRNDTEVNEIIELERRLIKEKENENGRAADYNVKSSRKQRVIKVHNLGARPAGNTKHFKKDIRRPTARKGFSVHPG